eukprot:5461794-Amphidinium_carterae.1
MTSRRKLGHNPGDTRQHICVQPLQQHPALSSLSMHTQRPQTSTGAVLFSYTLIKYSPRINLTSPLQ